jgi:WD repeat-containing protein 26
MKKAPPQLWKLELVKDRENSAIVTGRLSLRHTYMPKVPVDFAGPSYFGGKNDTLVLCAGKGSQGWYTNYHNSTDISILQ